MGEFLVLAQQGALRRRNQINSTGDQILRSQMDRTSLSSSTVKSEGYNSSCSSFWCSGCCKRPRVTMAMEQEEAHACITSSAVALLLLELQEPSEGSGLSLGLSKPDVSTLSCPAPEITRTAPRSSASRWLQAPDEGHWSVSVQKHKLC